MSKLRIEKRNLWKTWNWKKVNIEFTIFGFTVIGFLYGRAWFMVTLLNFQLDVEWYEIFLDKEGEAWSFLWDESDEENNKV